MASDNPFKPYVSDAVNMPEFTWRAVLVGTVLGMIFGASSLYLVLKVGMTVSASIPVAVISLTLFKLLSRVGVRKATILEHNITQTAGSAGESIAFGVGATMPAIMILGFGLEITHVMVVAVLGALLGILMMIPLRRALIVQEHGRLRYPEGTACAEVLKAGAPHAEDGAKSGLDARHIFVGFGVGLIYKVLMSAFKLWKDVPTKVFGAPFAKGSVSAEISPELLGVGYIIGPAIAATMCAGGVLTYLCLIPMINYFGGAQVLPPGTEPISSMGVSGIRSAYVLYIGAGAVTAAGIISLVRSLPDIVRSIRGMTGGVGKQAATEAVSRTNSDIPKQVVWLGIAILVLAILAVPVLQMTVAGALLLVVFGFLFVNVSSRLTGEIGSSSNPISGMTIATLLLTCLIFLLLGHTEQQYFVTALSIGGIVCIAASNGGTTSQDLKTGFLIGATPRLQQYAILFGSLLSALILGPILLSLNQAGTVYVPAAQIAPQGLQIDVAQLGSAHERLQGPQAQDDQRDYRIWYKRDDAGAPAGKYLVDDQGQAVWLVDPGINGHYTQRPDGTAVQKFDAPKATLVSYIIKGVLGGDLPWGLVLLGVAIAITVELCGFSSLPFAVGVYLPLSTTTPILIGGMIRWWRDRAKAQQDTHPGVMLASGYIAGGAIAGIVIALLAGVWVSVDTQLGRWAEAHNPFYAGAWSDVLALLPFAALVWLLLRVRDRKQGAA